MILAVLLHRQNYEPALVKEMLADAAAITARVRLSQVPVTLELIKEFFAAGLREAADLLPHVPACPAREACRRAWEETADARAEVAALMSGVGAAAHEATPDEISNVGRLHAWVERHDNLKTAVPWANGEWEWLMSEFGSHGVADACFLLAARHISIGHALVADTLILRGLFDDNGIPFPAVRTIASLAKCFHGLGNQAVAGEQLERARRVLKGCERLVSGPVEQAQVADVRADFEAVVAEVSDTRAARANRQPCAGSVGKDPLDLISAARRAISQDAPGRAVDRLRRLLDLQADDGSEPLWLPLLFAGYCLALACGDADLEKG